MADELSARLSALEARVATLNEGLGRAQAALQPQTLRQSLEYTFDPRGGEPRFVDENGVTLAYAPAVQVVGAVTTVDVAKQRVVVEVEPSAPYADLQWHDDFAVSQFGSAYRDVFGLTVAGGAVSWNPAASNGGWAVKTGGWYDTLQAIQIENPVGNTGVVSLLSRTRSMPASTGLSARWDTGTGALDIYDLNAGAVLVAAGAGYVLPAGVQRWLVMHTAGDRVTACVSSVPPYAISTPAHILANVSFTLAAGTAQAFMTDSGIGFDILVFGAPILVIDEYYVWRM